MTAAEALSITWPDRFRPEAAELASRAELEIAAPPEVLWGLLVRAAEWSQWYPGAADVTFDLWPGPDLQPGSMFSWSTFDVRLKSVVNEFEPPSRIGWHAYADGVEAYHGWVLAPTATGTHVVTEESLLGLVPRFAVGLDDAITQQHGVWLERLAERALSVGGPVQ